MQSNRIKELRHLKKLSQQQVADYVGISRVAVAKWESGDTTNLKPPNLFKLAQLFSVAAEEIVFGGNHVATHPGEPYPAEPGADFVPVVRVQLRLEAGASGYHIQQIEGNGPPIFFRRDFLQGKGWRADRLFALKITGDSMEPALYANDLVVVNTAEAEPVDGEVFAINYEGQAVIKRLRRDAGVWWIDSDNPRHKPKVCDEHAILIGRICYKQSERI
ncbi:MAG: LexA family transcriptional regulator [Sterolibacterium sp.]|jgi:transcriptional regulator with XRE-family HTH domain|nr:LexA family transcriptional regulator [Sterolibacterium sp.]